MNTIYIVAILILLGIGIGTIIYFLVKNKNSNSNNNNNNNSCAEKFSLLEVDQPNKRILNVPPRRMWGWGGWANTMIGYCGESSVQIAATYFGNYFSQEQILKAGKGTFLLQTNDDVAFANLHLLGIEYFPPNNASIYDMLKWVKQTLDKNHPIIAGMFCNEPAGDASFDHQVVFCGYELEDDNSLKTIYVNDTYNIAHWPLDCSLAPYHCDSIGATKSCEKYSPTSNLYPKSPWPVCYVRRGDFSCSNNVQHAPYNIGIPNIVGVYDPPLSNPPPSPLPPPTAQNAFLAVTGNVDPYNELFPCWLKMNSVFEPNWGVEDQVFAAPVPIFCEVYIQDLQNGENYSLLRFDNPADVPNGHFINGNYTFRQDFTSNGCVQVINVQDDPLTWPFMSNGTYFFRCVKNTAPYKQNFPYGTDRTDTALGPSPSTQLDAQSPTTLRSDLSSFKLSVANYIRQGAPPHMNDEKRINHLQSLMNSIPSGYKNNNHSFGASAQTKKSTCPTTIKAVDPGIVCSTGPKDAGKIHPNWMVVFDSTITDDFGDNDTITCLALTFTPVTAPATAKNCLCFTIASADNSTYEDSGSVGSVGLDGRIYFECFSDPWLYLFSPDLPSENIWIMMNQTGTHLAKLYPV